MSAIEKIKMGHLTIKIFYDADAPNPREDYDQLGTMVTFVRDYRLGDDWRPRENPENFLRSLLLSEDLNDRVQRAFDYFYGRESWLRKVDSIMYREISKAVRHDWVVLSLNFGYRAENCFCSPLLADLSKYDFDGDEGYIYISLTDARKEWSGSNDEIRAKAMKYLQGATEEYSAYLSGYVYGYVVESADNDHLGSCWGFYDLNDCIEEAKSAAQSILDSEDSDTAFYNHVECAA